MAAVRSPIKTDAALLQSLAKVNSSVIGVMYLTMMLSLDLNANTFRNARSKSFDDALTFRYGQNSCASQLRQSTAYFHHEPFSEDCLE